jgi:hypothetical protein
MYIIIKSLVILWLSHDDIWGKRTLTAIMLTLDNLPKGFTSSNIGLTRAMVSSKQNACIMSSKREQWLLITLIAQFNIFMI